MAAVTLAYALKVGYFYYHTELPWQKIPYALVTAAGFFLLFLFLRKHPRWFLLASGLFSFLLHIDLLYYRYFSDLFSLRSLHQASQLSSVFPIVVSLFLAADVLLWVDILAFPWLRKRWERHLDRPFWQHMVLPTFLALTIVVSVSAAAHYTGVKQYEFFNHHVFDLVTLDIEHTALDPVEASQIVTALVEQRSQEERNQHFGLASGRNLIVIQFESLQQILLQESYYGQEITPYLNGLAFQDSFVFSNYYHQVGAGSSSDAEFASLNSLYPVTPGNAYDLYDQNAFYGLPWILREHGYTTYAYHGNIGSFWNRDRIYPRLGFQHSVFADQYVLGDPIGFGLDDHDFFEQTVEYMKEQPSPWFSFLITMTSHKPFRIPETSQELVLDPEDANLFGDYLQSIRYADHALGEFLQALRDADLYSNSIIVIYGDHHGIGTENRDALQSMERFLGTSYVAETMLKVPLIVHIPGIGEQYDVSTTGGHLDLLPTLLNVLGIENTYLTLGRDLLNVDSGFTAFQAYVEPKSFVDGQIFYEASRDGLFEHGQAYHRDTHQPVSLEHIRQGYLRAMTWMSLSKKLLEANAVLQLNNDLSHQFGRDGAERNELRSSRFSD